MDFLKKLEKINVDERAGFSKEDLDFVDSSHARMTSYVEVVSKFYHETLNPIFESDVQNKRRYFTHRFRDDVRNEMRNICTHWVDDVLMYFRDKYKVKIKGFDTGKRSDVTTKELLEHIQKELGGLDFQEKAKQQIMEGSREIFASVHYKKPELKNKNIKVESVLWWSANWSGEGYYLEWGHSRDRAYNLAKALHLFEFEDPTTMHEEFAKIPLIKTTLPYNHEVKFSKIKKIRFFKNRSITITFSSHETAKDFYNKFCQ